MLKPEKKLCTQRIYQGRAVNLRVDTVEKASGTKTTREVVEHSDCIAVVALDEQGNVLLVRQYRAPAGARSQTVALSPGFRFKKASA